MLNPKPFEIAQQKLQYFYNLERNEFSPNFKGVAQKMGLQRSLEVLESFGRKCKSVAARALKFCTKRVPISEIFKIETFSSSKSPQLGIKKAIFIPS